EWQFDFGLRVPGSGLVRDIDTLFGRNGSFACHDDCLQGDSALFSWMTELVAKIRNLAYRLCLTATGIVNYYEGEVLLLQYPLTSATICPYARSVASLHQLWRRYRRPSRPSR